MYKFGIVDFLFFDQLIDLHTNENQQNSHDFQMIL
jgi:hypothetical protein